MKRDSEIRPLAMNRVFIVGCPRSGTTLLQALLSTQSDVTSFPESHFFPHLFSHHRLLRWLGVPSKGAGHCLRAFVGQAGFDRYEQRIPRRGLSAGRMAGVFSRLLDDMAAARSCDVWIEKTPRHLHYIDVIRQQIPDAKFIHIVRDAPDVVASLYQVTRRHPRHWGGALSIDLCIERWLDDVSISRRYEGSNGHLVLRYEELIRRPHEVIREACDFIGVSFREQALGRRRSAARNLFSRDEPWKQRVMEDVGRGPRSKFQTQFDAAQQRYILQRLAEGMSQRGV